jgi:glycosyltransferase involved in cell wall biosynthesis
MKIVLVHNRYQQPGGEDVVFEQEKNLLEHAGHQVIAYCRSNDEIQKLGALERLTLVKRGIWASDTEREFTQLLDREHPDLVHVHNAFLMISASVFGACKSRGIPVIQTLHNFRMLCPAGNFHRAGKICLECTDQGLWRSVYHGCYRESRPATAAVALMNVGHRWLGAWNDLVDCYIALTEFSRNTFIAAGLPAHKVVVKPNFLYPDPGLRESPGSYALFAGRLSPDKGVATLLDAWARVLRPGTLRIVGDGPHRQSLEAQRRRLNLSGATFLGRRSHQETIAEVKSARFVIVPSVCHESFPVVLAESFACGTPVICSRLGGMAEIVDDHRTGLHFTAGDADDLARKVNWALAHPAELSAMGRAARQEYETRYTSQQNYPRLLEIYQRTVAASA